MKNDYESELIVFNDSNQKNSNIKQLKNYHIETAYKLTPKSDSSWESCEKVEYQRETIPNENQNVNLVSEPPAIISKPCDPKIMLKINSDQKNHRNKEIKQSTIEEFESSYK